PVRVDGTIVAAVGTIHDLSGTRAAEREREQFLSIVSHELRTPLTPLKALAQLIRSRIRRSRENDTPLELESLERNLAAIERQVDRMNGLVNDLLSKLGHAFVRGAGRAESFAGMGVGLYVARLVAEAHAGRLAIESDGDGKGTTVKVTLPLG